MGRYTPRQCMLGYGQQAGGTHPTGMHSCLGIPFVEECMKMKDIGLTVGARQLLHPLDPRLSYHQDQNKEGCKSCVFVL